MSEEKQSLSISLAHRTLNVARTEQQKKVPLHARKQVGCITSVCHFLLRFGDDGGTPLKNTQPRARITAGMTVMKETTQASEKRLFREGGGGGDEIFL